MFRVSRDYLEEGVQTTIEWIGPDHRLDACLKLVFPDSSREKLVGLIERGIVEVPRGTAKASRIIKAGDTIILRRDRWIEAPVEKPTIIYEKDDVVVFNKPAGLPVHPAGRYQYNTFSRMYPDLKLCHRLDRETSGILVTAKSTTVAGEIGQLFQQRSLKKYYLAKLSGQVLFQYKEIDLPIGSDENSTVKLKMTITDQGLPAKSEFWHLQNNICLVSIHTGRQHQVRVHAMALGNPLEGDILYYPGGDVIWDKLSVESLEEWKSGNVPTHYTPSFYLHSTCMIGLLESPLLCFPPWIDETIQNQALGIIKAH